MDFTRRIFLYMVHFYLMLLLIVSVPGDYSIRLVVKKGAGNVSQKRAGKIWHEYQTRQQRRKGWRSYYAGPRNQRDTIETAVVIYNHHAYTMPAGEALQRLGKAGVTKPACVKIPRVKSIGQRPLSVSL